MPGGLHEVDIAAPQAVDAGLIGDEPDPLAGKQPEILLLQHVETGLGIAVAFDLTVDAGSAECLVVSRERHAAGLDSQRCCHDGGNSGA
jgi:hypothetical protein